MLSLSSVRFRMFNYSSSILYLITTEPLHILLHTLRIFSLNSPCIFIILDIHQQNAQINKGAN
jgi:hypothetical protein